MERYKIIENKKNKTFYVIDNITGACILETENPETARRKVKALKDWHEV